MAKWKCPGCGLEFDAKEPPASIPASVVRCPKCGDIAEWLGEDNIQSTKDLKREIVKVVGEFPNHPDFAIPHIFDLLNSFEAGAKDNLKTIMEWTPEHVDLKAISKVNYPQKYFPKKEYGEICTDEDCKCPFFSESYLYNLLGKDDARTLLALIRKLRIILGEEG